MSLAPITSSDFDAEGAPGAGLPLVSFGQMLRALGMFIVLAVLLTVLFVMQSGRAAAEPRGFDGFIQSLWPQAHARGVSRATFDRATAGLTSDDTVLAKTH